MPATPAAVVSDELEAGARIGEYEVIGRLGGGAFGVVYEARHPVIDKRVAIKVLRRGQAGDGGAARRFVDEARAVNQIAHPGIVDIFAFGELPDGRPYFVMERLDGRSLGERLADGPLPLGEALPLLAAIAEAVDAAHAKGFVHRDLKPDNVFLCAGGAVKLLDFGVAKLVDVERTASGVIVGTPAYMAPEQVLGEPVDARTDVFALGVVAYRALTGKLPFDTSQFVALAVEIATARPAPPSRLAPTLPRTIDAPILAMLEKDPARRPATARAAIDALAAAATARPAPPWRLIGAAAAAVACAAALLAVRPWDLGGGYQAVVVAPALKVHLIDPRVVAQGGGAVVTVRGRGFVDGGGRRVTAYLGRDGEWSKAEVLTITSGTIRIRTPARPPGPADLLLELEPGGELRVLEALRYR
jgi:serine/threonine-protein kinase